MREAVGLDFVGWFDTPGCYDRHVKKTGRVRMDEFTRDLVSILDRPTGIGIFSLVVQIPGKGRKRYWFSLASGMAALQSKIEYRSRFQTLPDWVSVCHPDHQISLCNLAIRGNQALPEARPRPVAGTST
jgi:hypothetical protein